VAYILIAIRANSVSQARILGIFKTKRFLQGEKFSFSLIFRNLDEKKSTQGFPFGIIIEYPTKQREYYGGSVSEIMPLQETTTEPQDFTALSEGYVLFSVLMPKIGKVSEIGEVDLVQWSGLPLRNEMAFGGENIEAKRDVYTLYGFLVTAISFFILVLEKIYWLIKSLFN